MFGVLNSGSRGPCLSLAIHLQTPCTISHDMLGNCICDKKDRRESFFVNRRPKVITERMLGTYFQSRRKRSVYGFVQELIIIRKS